MKTLFNNKTMNIETITYPDIWYQVAYTWEPAETLLYFKATKIRAMDEENLSNSELEDEISADGYVKFDGCMNVKLDQGYAHFCGRYQTKQYAQLFDKIYDKALEIGCSDD